MQKALVALAAAAALLAACDRNEPQARKDTSSATGASQSAPPATPTTPANLPQPSTAEKREGGNPQQGQVDPKESVQHRDFKQPGDAQGPRSAETTPRK